MLIEEITEIMDEEDDTSLIGNKNLKGLRSTELVTTVCTHVPNIRSRIREQIIGHIQKKQGFAYYVEIRSFINIGCTKVGMFIIGDGNTATNPECSRFVYTIPHIFTVDVLIHILDTAINITGIREYNTNEPGKKPRVMGTYGSTTNTNFACTTIGRWSDQWK